QVTKYGRANRGIDMRDRGTSAQGQGAIQERLIRGPRMTIGGHNREKRTENKGNSVTHPGHGLVYLSLPPSSPPLFAERVNRSPGRRFLDRRGKRDTALSSATSELQTDNWLIENGPRELELLFRAIVFQPSTPILLADDE